MRGCQGAECGRRRTAQKIFASVGQKHQYRAGDTLIEQGKPSDQCYYILKGTVSLRKQGAKKEVAPLTQLALALALALPLALTLALTLILALALTLT